MASADPNRTSSAMETIIAQTNWTLIAQNVMCAYPISDIYAPPPRYLYYCLLAATFATIRYRWLSNIFLVSVAAYAASAAIHSYIIAANPSPTPDPELISVPFISSQSNLTKTIKALVNDTATLLIQPDAVELDIDPITAVVVTAYLVGLPLQLWSRTMRSSRIIRYMILLWNLSMLVGTICALVSWPKTNLSAPQYRFCFADVLDPESMNSDNWDHSLWRGSFNATIQRIYDKPNIVWQNMSSNCFYPCFNTSQVIRQSTSLKAVVATPDTNFAKLHNPWRYGNDEFRPLVYLSIILFSSMSAFLYAVSTFKLGSEALRSTIHEPTRAWEKRQHVVRQLQRDARRSREAWSALWTTYMARRKKKSSPTTPTPPSPPPINLDTKDSFSDTSTITTPALPDLLTPFRLLIDILALITVFAGLTLCPVIVVAFVCWIEWYIRNDGASNETINQVGQWSPLVSVAIVLTATFLYQAKKRLAPDDEIQRDIRDLEMQIRALRGELERRAGEGEEEGIEMR